MDIKNRWTEYNNLPIKIRLEMHGIKFTEIEYFGPLDQNEVEKIMSKQGHELCYFQFLELTDGYDSNYEEDENGEINDIQVTKSGEIFETLGRLTPFENNKRMYTNDKIKFCSNVGSIDKKNKELIETDKGNMQVQWVIKKGYYNYPLDLLKIIVLEITNDCGNSELLEKYKQLLFDSSRKKLLSMDNLMITKIV